MRADRSQQHARHLPILDPNSDAFFRSFWERAQEENENSQEHSEDHQGHEDGRHF